MSRTTRPTGSTRSARAALLAPLALVLLAGCGGSGSAEQALSPAVTSSVPSATTSEGGTPVDKTGSPEDGTYVPPPGVPRRIGPPLTQDAPQVREVTGTVSTEGDCRVLRADTGVRYVLRGDAAADVPLGDGVTVRGLAAVEDGGPCPGLGLTVAR